jgi:hypothetical protein
MRYSPKKIITKIKKRYQERRAFRLLGDTLQKNQELFNSKKGGTCFVLGNGPSINNQDLTTLADKETFVMNNFWRHPQYKIIRPKYYLAADLSSYAKNMRPVEAWGANHPGRGVDLPDSDRILSQVLETKLFFNSVAKNFIEQNSLFFKNQVFYILERGSMDEHLNFNIDPSKPIPFPKNSVVLALILAVYMGFETIYLLGCDHDFLAYPSSRTFIGFKRFFDDPAGSALSGYQEKSSYEDMVTSCLRLFKNYRLLAEKIAKLYPNVKIYNATPNSFLDVFPMVNFEDIK